MQYSADRGLVGYRLPTAVAPAAVLSSHMGSELPPDLKVSMGSKAAAIIGFEGLEHVKQ